jgi:hypothetical protein
MIYLSKARSYFDQNSTCKFANRIVEYMLTAFTVRRLKSGLLAQSDIESYFDAIAVAQETVDRCSSMVEMQSRHKYSLTKSSKLMKPEQIDQYVDLKRLLEHIDSPIERMSTNLASLTDGFECKWLT